MKETMLSDGVCAQKSLLSTIPHLLELLESQLDMKNLNLQNFFLQLLKHPEDLYDVPSKLLPIFCNIQQLLKNSENREAIVDELLSITLSYDFQQPSKKSLHYLKDYLETTCPDCRKVMRAFLFDSLFIASEPDGSAVICEPCLFSFCDFMGHYYLKRVNIHCFNYPNYANLGVPLAFLIAKTKPPVVKINLTKLSHDEIVSLLERLRGVNLSILDFTGSDLSLLRQQSWFALLEFAKTSKLQQLILDSVSLFNLTLEGFVLLLELCNIPSLSNLSLQGNYLASLNDTRWFILLGIFNMPHLKILDLSDNELEGLTLLQWQYLQSCLHESSLTTLVLNDNYFSELNAECWELFCHIFPKSLQRLCLDNCDIFETTPKQLSKFLNSIKQSGLHQLKLSYNNGEHTENTTPNDDDSNDWIEILDSMKKLPVEILNLNSCYLAENKFPWLFFGEVIATTKINRLFLSDNTLFFLKNYPDWQNFCTGIGKTRLYFLDLSRNSLGHFSTKEYWQVFGLMLHTSRITELDLSFNDLNLLSDAGWNNFCDGLRASFVTKINLQDNSLSEKQQQQVNQILENNLKKCFLSKAKGLQELISYAFWQLPNARILSKDASGVNCQVGAKRKAVPDEVIDTLRDSKRKYTHQ